MRSGLGSSGGLALATRDSLGHGWTPWTVHCCDSWFWRHKTTGFLLDFLQLVRRQVVETLGQVLDKEAGRGLSFHSLPSQLGVAIGRLVRVQLVFSLKVLHENIFFELLIDEVFVQEK